MHRKRLDTGHAEVVGPLIDHAAEHVLRTVTSFHPFVLVVKCASPCMLDGGCSLDLGPVDGASEISAPDYYPN
jgi:hypothetical protein